MVHLVRSAVRHRSRDVHLSVKQRGQVGDFEFNRSSICRRVRAYNLRFNESSVLLYFQARNGRAVFHGKRHFLLILLYNQFARFKQIVIHGRRLIFRRVQRRKLKRVFGGNDAESQFNFILVVVNAYWRRKHPIHLNPAVQSCRQIVHFELDDSCVGCRIAA